jgi:acetoacetyl-CoA reductase
MLGKKMTKKKIALITGGVGGIGSAICRELARKGHQVIAGYHPAEEESAQARFKEWQAEGIDIHIVSGDVSSFASCTDMAKKIQTEVGTVQVLVNCAGITRDKTLKKMNEDDWNAVLNVDLNSLFNVTKQFADAMTDSGFGRIVNISSVNGKKGQFGQTNYSAAKAGVHGFTMALAQEVARKGVTVNSISPGYTETPMTKAIPEDITQQIVAQIPVGRMAKPEEIAYAVGFLTDARAGYITGVNLSVNGGLFISF